MDDGLADGAGLAGGGRIDGTAGEVDGGARLRLAGGCGPAPAKGQQMTKGVAGTLVR